MHEAIVRTARYTWIVATKKRAATASIQFFQLGDDRRNSRPFEENVAITKRAVERAHAKEVSVEAELGQLGGVEEK